MKKLTTLLTIIFCISTGIFSQVGEIKGFVKDKKTEEPIWNVAVYVEFAGNLIGDAADFEGRFTIKPLSPGKYTVTAKIPGYQSLIKKDVLITSDNITYVNFDLNPSAEQLPEFKIEEYEVDIINKGEPGIQHVLPKELKNSVHRNNPINIVTSLPGVTLGSNGKDVYIRGSRPTSTQFITDGVKSITGDIGIPGQAIGSIKVYTGGVPSRYGDVSGGVIVVETKSYFDLAQEYK